MSDEFMQSPMDDVIAKSYNRMIASGRLKPHILDEVKYLIDSVKQREYGDKKECFGRIANYWNTYLRNNGKLNHCLTTQDVAMLMVLFKMGRLDMGYKHDTIADLIGYAAIYEQLVPEDEGEDVVGF